jgi:ubiquitin carboxyl-terminal hydrolase 5/13
MLNRVRYFSQSLHRGEQSQDTPTGVLVCLHCFDCGCDAHAQTHTDAHAHPVRLGVKRTPVAAAGGASADDASAERPAKISKLAIGVEGGAAVDPAVEYATAYAVSCAACDLSWPGDDPAVAPLVAAVRDASAAGTRQAAEAWELELTACEHTLCLAQPEAVPRLDSTSLVKCGDCELTRNLWLCLSCGKLLCGRKNWDGSGGNGHALEHGAATGHHVVVKMGTITPEGKADVYCYACDDERVDPELPRHLNRFGLAVEEQRVTEKSLAELNLELNIKFDFSMTTESGVPLEPLCGPGLVGLRNIGNSCYIASALQCLLSVPEIAEAYLRGDPAHDATCRGPHADCWRCQMRKLARGLTSDEDSYAARWANDDDHAKGQVGASPAMIKALVAGDHPEFRTTQQQDAFEFLQHMLREIGQRERAAGGALESDPSALFAHRLEQRLQCSGCRGVRYAVEPTQHTFSAAIPLPDDYHGEERGKEWLVWLAFFFFGFWRGFFSVLFYFGFFLFWLVDVIVLTHEQPLGYDIPDLFFLVPPRLSPRSASSLSQHCAACPDRVAADTHALRNECRYALPGVRQDDKL